MIEDLAAQYPDYLTSPNTLAWMLDGTMKMSSTMEVSPYSRGNDLEAQQAYENLENQRGVYNRILSNTPIFMEKISYLVEKLNLPPIQIVAEFKMALASIPNLNEKEINILLFGLLDRVSCDDLLQEASRRLSEMAHISGIADEEIGLSLQKDLAAMAFQTAVETTQQFERTSYLNCDDKKRYPTSKSYLKASLSAEQMADFYLSQTQLYLWTASQVGPKDGKIHFLKKATKSLFPTHLAIDTAFFETSQQEVAFKKKYNELREKIVSTLGN